MKSRVPLFLLLIVGLLIPSFASAQTSNQSLIYVLSADPDTLDPHKTATAGTGLVMRFVGDTLIRIGMDGSFVPGIAESWEASEDGLTWTFHLRDDVLFHNGKPVTAQSVKDSFLRALEPEIASPITGGLVSAVTSFDVLDDYTLAMTIEEPFAPFLDNLADPRAAIVDVDAAKEMGSDFGRTPVLTGPFKVDRWVQGDRVVLKRNDDYVWGPDFTTGDAPKVEELVLRIMVEDATAVAAFESGEAHILPGVPSTDVERLLDDDRFELDYFLRKGVGLFLEMNVTKEPFTDPLVREAMNYAIDKDVILQVALRGLGETAHGMLPPSIWGYWEEIVDYAPSYDPERAVELLAEAGWEQTNSGWVKDGETLEFALFTQPIDSWIRSAQVVQGQLAEIGINISIQQYESGTLLDMLRNGESQANFMGYTYTNPDISYLWFHSDNIGTGLAHSHFDDAHLDELIELSRLQTDPDERAETYAEIQRYISDNSLWVPLWTNHTYVGWNNEVHGAFIHPEGYIVLNDVWLE